MIFFSHWELIDNSESELWWNRNSHKKISGRKVSPYSLFSVMIADWFFP